VPRRGAREEADDEQYTILYIHSGTVIHTVLYYIILYILWDPKLYI
jgi:hypothetical protein